MKLTQIPKQQVEAVRPPDEKIQESTTLAETEDLNVYGLDPTSPDYEESLKRLKKLRLTDPKLFRKLTSGSIV